MSLASRFSQCRRCHRCQKKAYYLVEAPCVGQVTAVDEHVAFRNLDGAVMGV
jgi:hypothetical protein